MKNLDRDIIITNIESLIKKNGINQAELVKQTGISQPQMSKALNRENKAQFTLEQICLISDYFDVSIDYIVGNNKNVNNAETVSTKEICSMLMKLIENRIVLTEEIEKEEEMYYEYSVEKGVRNYKEEKDKNIYTAFYFSNFNQPDIRGLREDQIQDLYYEVKENGNCNENNYRINEFIDYYLKLLELYKINNLPKEIFDTAIEDRLNSME